MKRFSQELPVSGVARLVGAQNSQVDVNSQCRQIHSHSKIHLSESRDGKRVTLVPVVSQPYLPGNPGWYCPPPSDILSLEFRRVCTPWSVESGARNLSFFMSRDGLDFGSDVTLVNRYLACGDEDCFSELFRRYGRRVYACCYRMVRNAADAEELSQRVFFRAFAGLGSFRGDTFGAWLLQIARHECINHLKSATVRHEPEELDPEERKAQIPGFEEGLLAADEVRKFLNQLPPAQRVVVKLFYIDGYTYKEIAEKTGFSAAEVKARLQNGIGRLKRMVTGKGGENSEGT